MHDNCIYIKCIKSSRFRFIKIHSVNNSQVNQTCLFYSTHLLLSVILNGVVFKRTASYVYDSKRSYVSDYTHKEFCNKCRSVFSGEICI